MSDKKRELTEEELKVASGGVGDGAGDIGSGDALDGKGDEGGYRCDDDPGTDDCASSSPDA